MPRKHGETARGETFGGDNRPIHVVCTQVATFHLTTHKAFAIGVTQKTVRVSFANLVHICLLQRGMQGDVTFLKFLDLVEAHWLIFGTIITAIPCLRILGPLRRQRDHLFFLRGQGEATCGTSVREPVRHLDIIIPATHACQQCWVARIQIRVPIWTM